METVRKNKIFLIDTLSSDSTIVLQHVQTDAIITKRDYNKLNHPNHTGEQIIINLLDNVMSKGEETCQRLLKMLEKNDLKENFPRLKELSGTHPPSHPPQPSSHPPSHPPQPSSQPPSHPPQPSSHPPQPSSHPPSHPPQPPSHPPSDPPSHPPQPPSHPPSHPPSDPPSDPPPHEGRLKDAETDCEYKMSSTPRGVCLIINNMDFGDPEKYRYGSEKDEEALRKLFEWLGFTLKVHRNQTAEEMKSTLNNTSRERPEGDCFVCCILSHGIADGLYGTDEKIVKGTDIYQVFNGTFCPSLINKPKVFFIQACRGVQHQSVVKVQADGSGAETAGRRNVQNVNADAVQISIPAEADFLIAKSTVKGFFSYRTDSGSWFIQTLCQQMNKHCPRGEDIYSILLRVNEEISQKCGVHDQCDAKQMPVQKLTLRKKLVFRVPE